MVGESSCSILGPMYCQCGHRACGGEASRDCTLRTIRVKAAMSRPRSSALEVEEADPCIAFCNVHNCQIRAP